MAGSDYPGVSARNQAAMRPQLLTPVSELTTVGRTTADRLQKLGISTVADLLFYYPFRYEDLTVISPIGELQPASTATVRGKIELLNNRRSWQRKTMLTEGLVSDGSGSVKVIWFNQPFITKMLAPGDEVYLAGKVTTDKYTVQLVNPIYEKVRRGTETVHTARIVPLYSLTEKLTQKQLRWLMKMALPAAELLPDWLPDNVRTAASLVTLPRAIQQVHFPDTQASVDAAVRRLKFNELFLFLLQSHTVKQELRSAAAYPIPFLAEQTKEFVATLPFELTQDQRRVAWQILRDLARPTPMNRLLEGEVGSGKTVVAAMVILNAALNDFQTVLMAPTEILARQHFTTLRQMFASTTVRVALLTHSYQQLGGKSFSKSKIISAIRNGNIDVVIGTHALIQQSIVFHQLALAIIDEQHRFGVEQRKMLNQKGSTEALAPHFLSMTATPIPRSLALTLYGDLDLSIIKELPRERKKIITRLVGAAGRAACYRFITQQVAAGRQVFVVCPLIDPSDRLGVKSVTEEFKKLTEHVFPDLKIAMLHGKLKAKEKEVVMANFLARQSDILVTTSVVEVGVDVPNASVMLIEDAERFGLAQLHQFRGRVGRGPHQSYCFLLSESVNQKTKARLAALVSTQDGFELAELDLKFRGPGELFGLSQSGWPAFRIASLFDYDLIGLAKNAAETVMTADPTLQHHPELKSKIEQLNRGVHLE